MQATPDITTLDDPAFLAAKQEAREMLAATPADAPEYAARAARAERMNAEFIRRAGAAWQQAGAAYP